MWCIVLGNSFLGRRFSEGVIIIINMMKRTPKHNFSSWGALGMRYCMLRIQAWPDECNYSIKQAASKTPAKRTRIEPEDVKLQKSMREWLFLIHPFDPFPTVIFILKDSFPQKFYIWPVWETNNKIQMVNFQNGDDAKRDFKAILCLTALHLCAMPSRIFFVVFQLWQPVGNQRAAILIFVIHIYTIELVCSTRKLMISFNWSMKLMVVLDN